MNYDDSYDAWREEREPEIMICKAPMPEAAPVTAAWMVGLREDFFSQCVSDNVFPAAYANGVTEVCINDYVDEIMDAMMTMRFLEYARERGRKNNRVLFESFANGPDVEQLARRVGTL